MEKRLPNILAYKAHNADNQDQTIISSWSLLLLPVFQKLLSTYRIARESQLFVEIAW